MFNWKERKMKSFLIMIDNQVGFNTTDKTTEIGKKIVDLSQKNFFDYQIATMYKNDDNLKTNLFTRLQNWHFLKTEPEYKYVDNLKYDYTLTKYVYSAVNKEMINKLTELNGGKMPKCIFLVGMDTECCVLKTAIDFFEIGVIPILLKNYTASNSGDQATDRGFKLYERLISPKTIINTDITSREEIEKIIESFKDNFNSL